MLAKLKTFSLLGIDALPVEVEVDVSPAGLPKTVPVGTYYQTASSSALSAKRVTISTELLPMREVGNSMERLG
jgi:magnesium chelatase family protein